MKAINVEEFANYFKQGNGQKEYIETMAREKADEYSFHRGFIFAVKIIEKLSKEVDYVGNKLDKTKHINL